MLVTRSGFPRYNEHTHVEWSTLRCNMLAFGLVTMVLLGAVPLEENNVFLVKFVGSFCGALSAYGGTLDDSARLFREGKFTAAVANVALNFAASLLCWAIVCLL